MELMLSFMNLSKIKDIRWKRVIDYALEEAPNRVLDVGCSSGNISSFLVNRSIKVFGADIMFDNLWKARDKGITPIICDLSKGLPYRNQTFDCILAGEIIEHIIDTDYFLEEVNRVLISKGVLIITTPNLVNLENRLRILIGKYPIFVDYTSRGDNHVRVYTGRALKKQLTEKGFYILENTGSFVPFVSYSNLKKINVCLMPVLSVIGSLFPSLAIHTIIKARKK